MQKRAAAMGFDWPDSQGPRAKIAEELAELDAALRNDNESGKAKANEELGDLLFSIVNYARHLEIDPEKALRTTCEKFDSRFCYIERKLAEQKLSTAEVDLQYLDALWSEAKLLEQP